MMKHVVIGLGQVGRALQEVLNCEGHDPEMGKNAQGHFDYMHICFPYGMRFAEDVHAYQAQFKPIHTIIHSTVPIGTSLLLGAAHSPVRGKHPDLALSLKTFTKYVGGWESKTIAKELQLYDINTVSVEHSDDTEAGKLFDLMQYGISILLNKEIHKFCEEHGLDFDLAYREFNTTYNDGYSAMSMPQVRRPVLEYTEGKIGGHCVVPMMELLPMESAKKIIRDNATL